MFFACVFSFHVVVVFVWGVVLLGVVCLFLLVGRWGVGELRVVVLFKS